MDTSGPVHSTGNKSSQRKFFQWAVKWFYTDLAEDTALKPDASELACLLQAIGFQLREFEKHEDDTDENKAKHESLRVTIECGSSKMRAVMELGGVNCHCPNQNDAKDASFWSVSGTGPMGSMDSINKVEETGSNLLPSVPKGVTNVVRDVTYRLFKMINNVPDVNQNTDSNMNLSALENALKNSPKPANAAAMKRRHTQPDLNPARYRSLDTLTSSYDTELPPPGNLRSPRHKTSSTDLSKQEILCSETSSSNHKDTPDIVVSGPHNSGLPNPPILKRENTWDMELDAAIEEPRPSPPKVSSSPVPVPQLCTSLGQISLQSDGKENTLADFVIIALHNLEKALSILTNNSRNSGSFTRGEDGFVKPALPRNSSFRISPGNNSRPSSSCSLPSRSVTRGTSLQKPSVRRSVGATFPKTPTEKKTTLGGKNLLRRKSAGTPTNPTKLSGPKLDTPRPGTSGNNAPNTSTSLATRIYVAAKRRVSPDPKNSPSQSQKPNVSLNISGITKTAPSLQKTQSSIPGPPKASSGSAIPKFGFARKKL